MKTSWKVVNSVTGGKANRIENISLRNENGIIKSNLKQVAEYASKYLVNIPQNHHKHMVSNSVTNEQKYQHFKASIVLFPVTEEEVLKCIMKLKCKTSVGIDEVPMKIIKECSNVI
jgi:hypothetical protein